MQHVFKCLQEKPSYDNPSIRHCVKITSESPFFVPVFTFKSPPPTNINVRKKRVFEPVTYAGTIFMKELYSVIGVTWKPRIPVRGQDYLSIEIKCCDRLEERTKRIE